MQLMPIVDRHVLRQITPPLAATMSIGLLMLLGERMVRLLDTTLGKKNSFAVVFEMLAYLVPHYLGTAIPAALFLGLMFGFSRMSANSETDAFLASGIGLNRLARPVIILSAFVSLATLFISGWAQPYTRYLYRSVAFDVRNVEFFYLAEEGVFMQSEGRTFILDTLDRSQNAFNHIFIYEDHGSKGSETITATRGALIEVPSDPRPVLHLEDGHRITFDENPAATAGPPVRPNIAEFAIADTPLGKISKDAFRPRGNDERELLLPELFQHLDSPPKGATKEMIWTEINKRLVNIVSPLVLPFLALPFTIGGKRTNRAYRFGFALVLLVAFHEIIEQGCAAAYDGKVAPWLVTWLPLGLLSLFAGWRYYAACFTVNRDPLDAGIDRIGEAIGDFRERLMQRLGWSST